MRLSFIINNTKGLSKMARDVMTLVEDSSDLEGNYLYTNGPKHAISLAYEEASKADVIIAVGGDGTCNEVINGLGKYKGAMPKFAVIPTGSGNDFFSVLPTLTPEEFISRILNNSFQVIDLGKVGFKNKDAYFLNVADIGFGAKVVELLNKQRKKGLGGKLSYVIAILRTFFLHKKAHIEIQGDNFEFKGKFLMVAFCNGSTFGHGLVINPDARIDSNKLNLTVIGDVSIFAYILNLSRLKKGGHINHSKVHYFETESATIKIIGEKQWMEGDGEILGANTHTVSILANAIKLIC
ncbi:MAG: diacylglycerol kinase family lipid kinase [Putridiphycobacter sp.]|nr:diacylglycerol kinase family lipid kinase [Putridiphycobacter sp.]